MTRDTDNSYAMGQDMARQPQAPGLSRMISDTSGNQRCNGKYPMNGGFNGKIIYN